MGETIGIKHNGWDSAIRDRLVSKVKSKYLPDSHRGDFRCRRAIDSSIWK